LEPADGPSASIACMSAGVRGHGARGMSQHKEATTQVATARKQQCIWVVLPAVGSSQAAWVVLPAVGSSQAAWVALRMDYPAPGTSGQHTAAAT
jgi:hypothetical protein